VGERAWETARTGLEGVLRLLIEVVVGMWLLCLFALALAWDALDRRFGFEERRRQVRPVETPGAYGVGGPYEEAMEDADPDPDSDGA
jgi:hypothetical protein